MLNVAMVLRESAKRYPQKPAVVAGPSSLTFGELDERARRFAGALRDLGIAPGDKVALACPNLPAFTVAYFGILAAGAVVVPLNVLLKAREIAYHLEDSQARALVCFAGTPELPLGAAGREAFAQVPGCRHFVEIPAGPESAAENTLDGLIESTPDALDLSATAEADSAVILYTSGTTGQPKGAELTHSNIFLNAQVCADMMRYRADDIALVVLPLFHSFGQVVQLVAGMLRSVTSVLLPRFEPEAVLAQLSEHRVTVFCGVPTMYWALLHAPEETSAAIARHLRLAVSGGASLPVQVLRDFEQRFEVPILEGYGLSETSPVVSFNHLDHSRKAGSVGTPIWGVDLRLAREDGSEPPIGEPGEILVRGHNVMKGYYRRPEATAETIRDGWLHTGDVGRVDEDGFYFIVDRTKDMILRGGFNVYPREIEEVLLQHPEISLAAVIGEPDAEHGEEVVAYIVPKEGCQPQPEAIVAWGREQMAAYKYPRRVEVRASLPMTATGKILKKELRQGT
ncbi:MAG: long-chain fatty acid--CoA ligase [Acidobacteriota bacterium]